MTNGGTRQLTLGEAGGETETAERPDAKARRSDGQHDRGAQGRRSTNHGLAEALEILDATDWPTAARRALRLRREGVITTSAGERTDLE